MQVISSLRVGHANDANTANADTAASLLPGLSVTADVQQGQVLVSVPLSIAVPLRVDGLEVRMYD